MITSPDNPTVKQARSLLEPKGRREQGRFLVEGVRLIEEAIRAGMPPALLFFLNQARQHPRSAGLLAESERQGSSLLELSPKVFGTLTDTVTSQGVIAVIPIPRVPSPPIVSFVLVLDQVRDPGNLGTILRSAEAAGAQQVVLAPGCVDPWNPKVVRSGMGAHFRLPLLAATRWTDVSHALEGLPVWLAEAREAKPYDTMDWTQPCALAIGGEAAGFSEEALQLGAGRVMIPMAGAAESLNAAMAATVLMFEVARQRRRAAGEA
jgi:RNA methyltransferase, TrmH family